MSRRPFTLDEKIAIIKRLENGEKNNAIAKEFSSSSSTISTIWKSRDTLKMFETLPHRGKRLRTAQHKELEEAVLIWFKQQQVLNLPITGPILQKKTDQLAAKMNIVNFKCSTSWIQRFRQRHNIEFGKISGESLAVNTEVCSNWLANIYPSLRSGYSNDDIHNADEAVTFFKLIPDKTLHFNDEKCSDGKLSKEKITALVAANMTETDKRKLHVIGKSKIKKKNITQQQADSESLVINDIDKDYIQIDDNLLTSQIVTDEDIIKDVMTSNEPDNDNDELDGDFGTLPSISEARAAIRTLKKFYYIKYEGTDDERKALVLLENSVDIKYSKEQSSIKNYVKKLNSSG